jgi:hypothetical protein
MIQYKGVLVGAVWIEPMSQARKGCDPTQCFQLWLRCLDLSRFTGPASPLAGICVSINLV